ncbi:MAG TPA: glycosyltransferase family 4 protein [Candidatus Dormibacteraeota bacterium]|jgi:spore coat protein SA|nr:glycosyltransferase family 4 protein [Candidatus Dormibacteraeota bacterium]
MTKRSEFRKARVAVLLSSREKFSAYYGGALARWSFEVYSRLASSFDVTVFGYPTPPKDLYPMHYATSSAWRLCDFISHIPLARRFEEELWLRALFARLRDFDVVHIHNRPQWIRVLRYLSFDGAIVLHLQNDHLGHWSPSMLDDVARHLDAVVVCSEYLRNTFAAKSSALAAKTTVVLNGVNTDLFFPQEELREPKTIFFVGRLHPEKGVLELVQAYARVLKVHPDAKLLIGGSTGFGTHAPTAYVREVEALAASIVKTHPGSVQFTGYLHHDRDLPVWFQRATLFACPSIFQEPFGLVNAEAMACATPVVGSRRGGIPEVLGDTGLLIDPEDVEGLADAMCTLLGDPEYARKLGRAAHQRCREMFGWQVLAGRWNSLLQSIANAVAEFNRRAG